MKKQIRILLIVVLSAISICAIAAFVGCSFDFIKETPTPDTNSHTHCYEIEERLDPTCTTDGYIKLYCECGEMYPYIIDEPATGHICYNFICNICGEIDWDSVVETPDVLVFSENRKNGSIVSYTVAGLNSTHEHNGIIVIPKTHNNLPVVTIASYAFKNDTNLNAVVVSENVTTIKKDAFSGCTSLYTVIISDSVETIEGYAFSGCTSLRALKLGKNLKTIGSSAFYDCLQLKELVLPDSITSIGNFAFYRNYGYSFDEIVLPENLQTVGGLAFNCKTLTINSKAIEINSAMSAETLIIGENVESISELVFCNCEGLKTVYWNAIDCPMAYPYLESGDDSTIEEIIFGENVKSISSNLLYNCSKITKIKLPDKIQDIGYSAFENCTGLETIIIPDSVEVIYHSAFKNCIAITSVIIPDNVEIIWDSAFEGCSSLINLTIGNSVNTIGQYAFSDCTKLKNLKIGESLEYIGESAFENCSSLTNITIPYSVIYIAKKAFYECNSLTSVYYQGTASDWGKIDIDWYNTALTNAVCYYYSDINPNDNGNYWHYDENGEIVIWKKEN